MRSKYVSAGVMQALGIQKYLFQNSKTVQWIQRFSIAPGEKLHFFFTNS